MNETITNEDVFAVMKSFCELNGSNEEIKNTILAVGAELLGVSIEKMCDLCLGK